MEVIVAAFLSRTELGLIRGKSALVVTAPTVHEATKEATVVATPTLCCLLATPHFFFQSFTAIGPQGIDSP